ncbi:toxin-antitoxin system HicB family antitoxin [Nonomuraea sp. K274]|uniref:Toxin-antitoxin system HicB family antitoxin n=1 Tax=Nonomuraea cypriaca TaxID=1187855 RepID=A0A931A7S5_9ACTN|nr:toxin-antitoxin system HicB family antitoxin [Nonomuraea cypriaca]MBF8184367.1 toxin-antitoxin system HicB family antitoxin [Nonomuraea cypriaca]
MDLAPYVDQLRRELAIAAGAGGEEARALAERLAAALESAARLALLEALSAAADEITRDLAPGSVEVRLRGRDPGFVVTSPPAGRPFEPAGETGDTEGGAGPPAAPPPPDGEEGGTARISLRVPEHLKPRIEEAAARDGLSVNAWLVRAVSAALEPGGGSRRSGPRAAPQTGTRYTGWVR